MGASFAARPMRLLILIRYRYPDYSYTFSNFDVAPGDSIKATVIATSKTSGTATIENLSTGDSVTHTFSNEASLGSLCETNAEWIVEVRLSRTNSGMGSG